MKELEELTREIREKLPRLKELTNGCLIETADKIFEINNLIHEVCDEDQIFDRFIDSWIFSDEYTIIGKEPMLNDVLEWIAISGFLPVEFYPTAKGDELGILFNEYPTNPLFWKLSNPYLKDQCPELISFLHSFVKNEADHT